MLNNDFFKTYEMSPGWFAASRDCLWPLWEFKIFQWSRDPELIDLSIKFTHIVAQINFSF